jgi:hypothetical protein
MWLSSCLLSKQSFYLLLFVGVECDPFILSEEHKLQMFKSTVLRKVFRPLRIKQVKNGGYYIKGIYICTYQLVLLR